LIDDLFLVEQLVARRDEKLKELERFVTVPEGKREFDVVPPEAKTSQGLDSQLGALWLSVAHAQTAQVIVLIAAYRVAH
jgi:hypothetical protein